MSCYPFQSTEHDASIAVTAHQVEDGDIAITVAAGSCVEVRLPMWLDDARGFRDALGDAIREAAPEPKWGDMFGALRDAPGDDKRVLRALVNAEATALRDDLKAIVYRNAHMGGDCWRELRDLLRRG